MSNEPSLEQFQKQFTNLEEEKSELAKKKRLWEEYQIHWQYLLREEQQLLEEVAYLSQGTVSATHATNQLYELEAENHASNHYFEEIENGFSQKKQQLYDKEEHLTSAYDAAKRKAEDYDQI